MTLALEIMFWGSLGLILYTYVGFPLLLLVRGLIQRSVIKEDITPPVSLVICAHNEADSIGQKLENLLAMDYPRDRLDVIVASDGSSDGTTEVVAGYADRGVRLLVFPRQGKIPVLNAAVAQATGEILVFSDANSMFARDALRMLLRPFADPMVGAVAGNQCYESGSDNAASFGERLYWSFDRSLKRMQARAGNAISSTGAIHAIRRCLFQPVPLSVTDDFVISTRAILQGFRLVFEPAAVATEATASSDGAEFRRKVRVSIRGLRALWAVRPLFNPFRYGFYSVQVFSHKLLRRSVGWLMIAIFGSSLALMETAPMYRGAVLAQFAFYGMALLALSLRGTRAVRWRAFRLVAVPFYFCLANLATVYAWLQLLSGIRMDVWDSNRHAGDSQPPALAGSKSQ